jgi:hypothetical protein
VFRTCSVSSAPPIRSARPKALREIDLSTHSRMGCTHAPRPGSFADGSGITTPSHATTLNKEDLSARERQPRQVLTLSILARHRPCGAPYAASNPQLSSET